MIATSAEEDPQSGLDVWSLRMARSYKPDGESFLVVRVDRDQERAQFSLDGNGSRTNPTSRAVMKFHCQRRSITLAPMGRKCFTSVLISASSRRFDLMKKMSHPVRQFHYLWQTDVGYTFAVSNRQKFIIAPLLTSPTPR